MKKVLFALMLAVGFASAAFAQMTDTITVRAGKETKAAESRLKIRFVEVAEDSRCPQTVACVWAGNARVKFEVTNSGGGNKMLEANTTMGPKGDQFDGWAINLVFLTPKPTKKGKPDVRRYVATFTITRLQR